MSWHRYWQISGALIVGLLVTSWLNGQAPPTPDLKVASFAPADDLVKVTDWTIKQIQTAVELPADDYAEDIHERTKKNALLLAVLTMHLSNHETQNEVQPGAVAMFKAAEELALRVKDQATAQKLVADIVAARSSTMANPGKVTWAMVRGQGALMKKTNEVVTSIKRNLTEDRFAKQQAALREQTVALAALAQATVLDTHEVKNPDDLPTWTKWAVEYRTLAGQLNEKVRAGDREAASKLLRTIDQTCHTCHQKFDPPKK